jgi:hypothetical protein
MVLKQIQARRQFHSRWRPLLYQERSLSVEGLADRFPLMDYYF